ncbi:MAG: division/cell wall cluster transcriptional repressor MraZ [Calditrichaeota bacterium]|nr:division/cell wall cluster transcriptional repressor MraZ [Calditrichota bacterium]MCB0288787.1 division/cell wall cluster transcriptional repressor MraZ [Calditrichota bacterium]MCB0303644.1 division/cell wall cluster transcriptional repressor MraZ [Calditrichota bacterium]MCB9087688.1 division/cell wall cluster transcriptional repressor MraZ [Calditrichia bacterium]
MNGFWGSFKSTLDNKGRINFPAKFRKNLREEDEDTLILIRGTEKCLGVYPRSSWQETVEEIKRKVGTGREFGVVSRRLMYQASEQTIDKQGRLNLPANLIEYAGLVGEVLVVGYEQKIEIWDRDRYRDYVESTESEYLKIAQELDI